MVAISLYRGNLHRVPDVPRRWLMPTHKITLTHFKSLLDRRSKALSRLRSTTTTTSNPNSNHNGTPIHPELEPENAPTTTTPNPQEEEQEEEGTSKAGTSTEVKDQGQLNGGDFSIKPDDVPDEDDEKKPQVAEKGAEIVNDDANLQLQKPDDLANPNPEVLKIQKLNIDFHSGILF